MTQRLVCLFEDVVWQCGSVAVWQCVRWRVRSTGGLCLAIILVPVWPTGVPHNRYLGDASHNGMGVTCGWVVGGEEGDGERQWTGGGGWGRGAGWLVMQTEYHLEQVGARGTGRGAQERASTIVYRHREVVSGCIKSTVYFSFPAFLLGGSADPDGRMVG